MRRLKTVRSEVWEDYNIHEKMFKKQKFLQPVLCDEESETVDELKIRLVQLPVLGP